MLAVMSMAADLILAVGSRRDSLQTAVAASNEKHAILTQREINDEECLCL